MPTARSLRQKTGQQGGNGFARQTKPPFHERGGKAGQQSDQSHRFKNNNGQYAKEKKRNRFKEKPADTHPRFFTTANADGQR